MLPESDRGVACWICGRGATAYRLDKREGSHIHCGLCGKYWISSSLYASGHTDVETWKLSSAVRMLTEKGVDINLYSNNYKGLIGQTRFPDNPFELMDALLRFLYRRDPKIGANIVCDSQSDYPAIGLRNPGQLQTILSYARHEGLIVSEGIGVELTLDGWRRLDQLNREGVDSNKVFVAMWFDESLADVWENGFEAAIRSCNYDPVRVDNVQYNHKICDEIIANIRSAKFVVADFTGQRGGVYYEAGFAHGLAKHLILTCRKDDFEEDRVHFDLNHHNFIVWEEVDDLVQKLVLRIKATIF